MQKILGIFLHLTYITQIGKKFECEIIIPF